MNRPVRSEDCSCSRNQFLRYLCFGQSAIIYQLIEIRIVRFIQPSNDLNLIFPIVLRDQHDHLLDDVALTQQVIRQQQFGVVLDLLEHTGQNTV